MGACYVDGDARDRDRVVGRIQRTAIPAGNPIVVAEGAGRAPDADEPGQPMLPNNLAVACCAYTLTAPASSSILVMEYPNMRLHMI